ncbi:hypothetical protein ACOMHN_006339 [Nucella lapillus]
MWKCYMKAVSSAHILLTFIPASYDDLLLLNEQDNTRDPEEKKTEEGDGGLGSRPQHTDTAGAGDTATPGDPDSAQAAPAACAAAPGHFEDTDSTYTGHTSAGGRRGSGALSGFGNPGFGLSTVITVTEPSPCHSPERSAAQSREDDVKEWVNTSCSAAVPPPAKGPMVIPIYVYDCHYHSITESLINPWAFSLPPDIHEDMTFLSESDDSQPSPVARGRLASFDKEASVVEEKEEVEFLRPGWRSSLDRKSVDSIGEGVGDFRRQCHLITESYFGCFVTGLYQSLRHNYYVSEHDMDAAISSICQETPSLEVDMTPFLLASCGHLQRLVGQARKEVKAAKEADIVCKHSVRFMDVIDIQRKGTVTWFCQKGHCHLPLVLSERALSPAPGSVRKGTVTCLWFCQKGHCHLPLVLSERALSPAPGSVRKGTVTCLWFCQKGHCHLPLVLSERALSPGSVRKGTVTWFCSVRKGTATCLWFCQKGHCHLPIVLSERALSPPLVLSERALSPGSGSVRKGTATCLWFCQKGHCHLVLSERALSPGSVRKGTVTCTCPWLFQKGHCHLPLVLSERALSPASGSVRKGTVTCLWFCQKGHCHLPLVLSERALSPGSVRKGTVTCLWFCQKGHCHLPLVLSERALSPGSVRKGTANCLWFCQKGHCHLPLVLSERALSPASGSVRKGTVTWFCQKGYCHLPLVLSERALSPGSVRKGTANCLWFCQKGHCHLPVVLSERALPPASGSVRKGTATCPWFCQKGHCHLVLSERALSPGYVRKGTVTWFCQKGHCHLPLALSERALSPGSVRKGTVTCPWLFQKGHCHLVLSERALSPAPGSVRKGTVTWFCQKGHCHLPLVLSERALSPASGSVRKGTVTCLWFCQKGHCHLVLSERALSPASGSVRKGTITWFCQKGHCHLVLSERALSPASGSVRKGTVTWFCQKGHCHLVLSERALSPASGSVRKGTATCLWFCQKGHCHLPLVLSERALPPAPAPGSVRKGTATCLWFCQKGHCHLPLVLDDGEDMILPEVLQLPRRMMSLLPSLWQDTQCEHTQGVHALVQDKFLLTVQRFFQPVASMPDYYYFCPQARQRTSVCDEYDEPEVTGNSTDEDDNTDVSIREEEEGEGTGMGDLTPRGGGQGAEVRDHSAHVSVDSNLEDSLSDIDLNATQDAEQEVMPLFIHFTCTLKRRAEQHHTSVTQLPQCLGDLLGTMKDPLLAINFGDFQVTFDINCMTLPSDSDLESAPKRTGFMRSMSNQSQSSSNRLSECEDDHDDTLSTGNSSDFAVEQPLSQLPPIQRDAVLVFRDEVEWLLRDEVAGALKHMHPISADALDFVTKHVKNSYRHKYPSCRYERVGLQFVYGPDRSLKRFVEEFERLSQPGYRLTKVKDFYILAVDRAHANNIVLAKALQTALVELSHEGGLQGPGSKGVDASKLFPAIEERSYSLPSILPSSIGVFFGQWRRRWWRWWWGGGGVGGGDENQPRSCSDAKFSSKGVAPGEERSLKQSAGAGAMEGEGEVGDASLRKSFSSAELQNPVMPAPPTSTASPEAPSGSLSAIKASPSSLFGHRSRHFSAPSGQGTPQSRASTLPQTPSIGSSRGSGTSDAGFEGDVSDENMDDTASLSDVGLSHPQLPAFWLVLTIHVDCVELFFHTRVTDQEGSVQRAEQELVSKTTVSIQDTCCKVNKQLLLNELNETHMCNRLLEPEADEDVCWTDRRTTGLRTMQDAFEGDDEDESEEGPIQGYLAATLDLEPGCFACDCMWKKLFFLHPRLKTGSQRPGISRGLLSLRTVLNKFSVGNRKNMFVIKETKLSLNVFYIKLKELTSSSLNDPLDINTDLETSMSEISLTSLAQRAETRMDAETRSEGDTTSLASAFSRASSRIEDMVELTVHGIAEPTTEIREDLMKVLQNRLDDTVLDVICVMLARNPQCKLRQEDVQFIQGPEEQATETLRLIFPSHAMMYLAALLYYLRQNLLLFLHTPCFHDDSPNFHDYVGGQNYEGGQWKPVPSEHAYLYISPQAGGRKGLACVVSSLVDGRGNPVHLLGCPAPSRQASANLPSSRDFKDMVDITVIDPKAPSVGPGPTALLQFRIWQKGSLDLRQLMDRLTSAVSHALCDIIMEYTLMTAPVCTTPRNLQDVKVLPVTSLPNSPVTVKKEPERKSNLGRKMSDTIRISLKPVPQSAAPFPTLREKAYPARGRVSSPPPEGMSQSFDWSQVQTQSGAAGAAAGAVTPVAGGDQVRSSAPSSMGISEIHSPELADLLAQYDKGDKGSLHAAFASLMQPWLAFCHEKRLASVFKLEMSVKATHSLEYILRELQSALSPVGVKAPLKVFKVLQYTTMDSAPISVPFFPCRPQPIGVDNQIESAMDSVQSAVGSVQYVVVAREHELWNTTVAPDSSDYQVVRIPTPNDLKNFQSGTKFHPKVTDLSKDKEASSGMNQIFIPRQKLLVMFVSEKKLLVYLYNYAGDVTSGVEKTINNIVNWHNARTQVLYSILYQKMGLFQHMPFEKPYCNIMDTNPYMHSTSEIDNLIRFSVPPREVTRRHSSMTAQSRSISRVLNQYRPFDDTYKNLKPTRPMHRTVNGALADHVARHGMQAQDIRSRYRKDAERMMKLQQIYLNWLQKSANPNSPVSEEYLDLLKQSSRLFHYCATHFLFCQQWRHSLLSQNTAVKTTPAPPPPTPERDSVTTKSRSRHSSGASITSQRTRRSDSQDAGRVKRPTDPSPGPAASGVAGAAATTSDPLNRRPIGPGPEDSWHQNMCQDFLTQYRNYLVSEFGFVCINVQPNMTRRAAQQSSSKKMEGPHRSSSSSSSSINLHKTLASGIILMELSLRDKFFILRMFVFDYLQLGITNHDMQMLFVDECEKYKDLIHVHSFAHDFHLRCINDYLRGNTSILHPNFHISNFLSDFLKIYPIPPSFARNCLAQESAMIRDLPCPGPQLFDYMRTQSRQFAMDVFRMSPCDVVESDFCFIKQDDFALVQIRKPDLPERQEAEERRHLEGVVADVELDGYNVTLIITQESARTLTITETDSDLLRLNFFVVLTRLRGIHPKRTLEKKFGDFRSSGTLVVQSHLEGSDSSSAGGGEGEAGVAVAVKQHLGVRQEHTNYLGYSNIHLTRIYTLLTSQIKAGREKIEDMVQMSKVKCRRDYLWQRMSATVVKDDGKKKGKQLEETLEPTLQPLSGGEFEELLQLVWQQPLNEVDPRLSVFSNMAPSWFASLLPVLTARFTHACRCFPSVQPSLHHTVILNNHWQDMFILMSVDSNTGCTALSQVLRNRGEEEEEEEGGRRVGAEPQASGAEKGREEEEGGREGSEATVC